jgi:hypothetical protein
MFLKNRNHSNLFLEQALEVLHKSKEPANADTLDSRDVEEIHASYW